MTDLAQHLRRQIAFSRATFGPGQRTDAVIDHIKKELDEVALENVRHAGAKNAGMAVADEWVDVVILALDGLTRELWAAGLSTDDAAERAADMIVRKQAENEERRWPDWRTAPSDRAIEHEKTTGLPTKPRPMEEARGIDHPIEILRPDGTWTRAVYWYGWEMFRLYVDDADLREPITDGLGWREIVSA